MYEKPVLLHTTGLEVAGYVNTYTHRLHFKPHQIRQGPDLYHVEPPSISVHSRRQISEIAAAFTRRLEPAALDWWANAVAWRAERAAYQQRTTEYATMLTLIGHGHHLSGYKHPVIVSYGSSWHSISMPGLLTQPIWRKKKSQPSFVTWEQLHGQFGGDYSRLDNFQAKAWTTLRKIQTVYPDLGIERLRGGVQVLPCDPAITIKKTHRSKSVD